MADLQALKIEQIAGVNDQPSVPTDADHPDGAYVTKKINDLIDSSEAEITNLESGITQLDNRVQVLENANSTAGDPASFISLIYDQFYSFGAGTNNMVPPENITARLSKIIGQPQGNFTITSFSTFDQSGTPNGQWTNVQNDNGDVFGQISVSANGDFSLNLIESFIGAFSFIVKYTIGTLTNQTCVVTVTRGGARQALVTVGQNNNFEKSISYSPYVVPTGVSLNIDSSLANVQWITINGNVTITSISPPVDGNAMRLTLLCRNAVAGGSLTFPNDVPWENGTPPVITQNTGDINLFELVWFGGNVNKWLGKAFLGIA